MTAEYCLLLFLQALLLVAIYFAAGVRLRSGIAVFSPVAWFLMFYGLTFLLPQCVLFFRDFSLITPGNLEASRQTAKLIVGQKVCVVFLFCFLTGFLLTGRKPPKALQLSSFSSLELVFVTCMGVMGFAAVVLLLWKFDPSAPRSSLVKSGFGKLLYGVSFWLTLATIVWSAIFYKHKRWLSTLVIFGLFGFSLFLLGGRGRVIWPMASMFAWCSICQHGRFSLAKTGGFILLFFALLQTLDPALLIVRGEGVTRAVDKLNENLSVEGLFVRRNFEAFQNVAVIAAYDRVEPRPVYLLNGSQRAFMKTYFPQVHARGVGFPASLPGGLWLVGRYPAVVFGAAVFGAFFGLLSSIYARIQSEFEVVVYCVAMPWLGLISGAYLEMYAKVIAAIGPGVLFAMLLRYAVGSRRLTLTGTPWLRMPRFAFGQRRTARVRERGGA